MGHSLDLNLLVASMLRLIIVTKFIRTGIADKNDSPPYFDKSIYEAEVDENEDIHHSVLTVTANTANNASRIRYEITGGNIGGAFGVKNSSGTIYVAGPLDYETRRKYELRLTATSNLKQNHTTVIIKVRDLNDNPPVFERPTYRTQITEEDDRNLPKRILQVTALDGDKDRPRNVVYFPSGQGIDTDNPANSKFDINRTSGEIFVLKPLDRDQPHGRPQWKFTIFAQDEGGEGLVGYSEVQVNLKDINDNAPHFPLGIYFANVTENATTGLIVMKMTAVDYDDPQEGGNARLVYSIEKNVIEEDTGLPIFEIEPNTGIIKTAVCCLDREKTPDYSIQVVAMDGGGLKGTGTASIKVKDINDMPPHFVKEEWFTEVDETNSTSLPTHAILTVTVHDEDEINNFKYKVVENSGYGANKFTMVKNPDGTGSLRIIEPLDYEDPLQRNGFRFKIQVNDKYDNGTHDSYHIDNSWVVVKLRDVNDNKPEFEKSRAEVFVNESVKVGKVIQTFRAMDADQGGKSKISYEIERASNRKRHFAINDKGFVSVQRPLDREKQAHHTIRILAIDDGIPAKTSTAELVITVLDVNDNVPTFLEDYRPVLPENVPSQLVAEIYAHDKDDKSKNNGGPFQFRLDPEADDTIRTSFKVEQSPYDSSGNGMAMISSLKSFDREYQKEYRIPIIIKDHGNPAMIGTSTLTVTIGDINDNKMQPGNKEINVYNYHGLSPDAEIGKVFVYDADDWDSADKTVKWEKSEHPKFKLNEKTGIIQLKQGIKEGIYKLRFRVSDHRHSQYNVSANVTVYVHDISNEMIYNSGSIRIVGVTDDEFIRLWDYQVQMSPKSKLDRLRDKLAQLFETETHNVEIFSIQLYQKYPPLTDVRFSVRGSNYKSVKLNGILLIHQKDIESDLNINITMIGIDECLDENKKCEGSCSNILEVKKHPYIVDANTTGLVGVRIKTIAECFCEARNTKFESCRMNPCFNGGLCVDSKLGITCSCPAGYNGPRCQQIYRSFRGNGWAWYPPLDMCDKSHLSIEFITRKSEGMLLYNGPVTLPKNNEIVRSDFISLELEKGYPRLLINFGSGTLQLKIEPKQSLDDGEWHRLDIFWDTENVKMIVDLCKSADVQELEDSGLAELNYSSCQIRGVIPQFNEYLNLNTPLQLGGMYTEQLDTARYSWKYKPIGEGFDGCIKNFVFNSKLYDLAHPGLYKNSVAGCPQTEELCNQDETTARCWYGGSCHATFTEAVCNCKSGWTGPTCTTPTTPVTFKHQSYVKYALSFEPDRFTTKIQLRFRTRQPNGELFRISDQHNREYCILEIKQARLSFRYNLNSMKMEENQVSIHKIPVDDGRWHAVKVSRYGSAVILEMDGGEGLYYNESFHFEGHQWLFIDKQEGVYAGGKVEFTGVSTFEVIADFQKSCLDDIRLDGKQLPLPPGMNGTQWGQATTARNLERGCPSNSPCLNVVCSEPFECVDLWNKHECRCGEGQMISHDGRNCIDKNECLESPCFNGGKCINQDPRYRYRCVCPEGFWGQNCELIQERHTFKLSMGAVTAIFICLLIIFVLVPVFLACNRRRESSVKGPAPEKDIRENVINYDDEGGGEDDMTAFDITTLQIPVNDSHPNDPPKQTTFTFLGGEESKRKNKVIHTENAINYLPYDDLRNFAYEGNCSTAGSINSLTLVNDDTITRCDHQDIASYEMDNLKINSICRSVDIKKINASPSTS